MLAQLGLRVEPFAGVIEVDVAAAFEAHELGAAQVVQHGCVRVGGVAEAKRRLSQGNR